MGSTAPAPRDGPIVPVRPIRNAGYVSPVDAFRRFATTVAEMILQDATLTLSGMTAPANRRSIAYGSRLGKEGLRLPAGRKSGQSVHDQRPRLRGVAEVDLGVGVAEAEMAEQNPGSRLGAGSRAELPFPG